MYRRTPKYHASIFLLPPFGSVVLTSQPPVPTAGGIDPFIAANKSHHQTPAYHVIQPLRSDLSGIAVKINHWNLHSCLPFAFQAYLCVVIIPEFMGHSSLNRNVFDTSVPAKYAEHPKMLPATGHRPRFLLSAHLRHGFPCDFTVEWGDWKDVKICKAVLWLNLSD